VYALPPALREPPASGHTCFDRSQQRKLGAVQLPNDRDRREGAQRGLVDRRQMVEVKQLRARRIGAVSPAKRSPT
jgi:hypothetical protein